MVRIRRIAAIAVLCVVAGAYGVASPAHADTPEVFKGDALATGLDLHVLGTAVTLGQATSSVKSAVEAVGVGAGQLLSLTSPALRSIATPLAPGPNTSAEKCAGVDLPSPLNSLLSVGIACGASAASFTNSLPVATGSGKVLGLGLSANTVLSQVDNALKLGDTLATTLNPIGEALKGSPLDGTVDTVVGLVKDVLQTKTLDVTLGESTSIVKSEVGKITSESNASGAVIRILPLPQALQSAGLPTDPVVTITVAAAKASATFDRGTGVATPTVTPSLVHIHLNSATNILGLHDIDIAPGVSQTILQGTPLESTIAVAAGSTAQSADRREAGASADGVLVHLLKGLGESAPGALDGGIKLNLAHAEASVGGALATSTPNVLAVEQVRQLPRTGGPGPLFPAIGAGILVLAVVGRRVSLRTR
jgi:hypothetical protein